MAERSAFEERPEIGTLAAIQERSQDLPREPVDGHDRELCVRETLLDRREREDFAGLASARYLGGQRG